MQLKILATMSLGLLAAACSSTEHRTVAPYGASGSNLYQSSTQACLDYGFTTGTAAYNRCVMTEQSTRANYRVTPGYSAALIATDAENACYSYGVTPNTAAYNRCVARETYARTYRDSAAAPVYRTDAQGYRVDSEGYRVDANGYRLQAAAPAVPPYRVDAQGYRVDSQGYRVDSAGYRITAQAAPYYPPAPVYQPEPTYQPGAVVYRDEFGNRYDGQGNRINASGQIIPMRESVN